MIEKTNSNPIRNTDSTRFVPDEFKKVARELESQFSELMLTEMNKTADPAEEVSSAENIYSELLTTERAKTLSENKGGLGLQNMILDQIYPKRLRNEITYEAYEKRKK
jgi:Rod binding domain-containing protein